MKGINNMQTITNNTEEVIYGMLTENTGTHFLDSGGSNGRMWQRNAMKTLEDFKNEPEAWFDGGEYPDVSKSAFWHLVNNLEHDAGLTAAYHAFAEAYPDESWLEINELWLNKLGVPEEGGDFYSESRWSFNTYNFPDNWLVNQTLQGSFFGMGGNEYLILQVHGGADVRGGYTKPQVFSMKYEGKEGFIFNAESAYFGCNSKDCSNQLGVRGYSWFELMDDTGSQIEAFTKLEEVRTCPCGGSWIN
jgi:hypothetical protein